MEGTAEEPALMDVAHGELGADRTATLEERVGALEAAAKSGAARETAAVQRVDAWAVLMGQTEVPC